MKCSESWCPVRLSKGLSNYPYTNSTKILASHPGFFFLYRDMVKLLWNKHSIREQHKLNISKFFIQIRNDRIDLIDYFLDKI